MVHCDQFDGNNRTTGLWAMAEVAMYTDKNIPIECPECSAIIEGKEPMVAHVIDCHLEYSPSEAVNFVDNWAEDAYERQDEYDRACNADQAYEHKLNVLRGKE